MAVYERLEVKQKEIFSEAWCLLWKDDLFRTGHFMRVDIHYCWI
jgi:hypothetical protein